MRTYQLYLHLVRNHIKADLEIALRPPFLINSQQGCFIVSDNLFEPRAIQNHQKFLFDGNRVVHLFERLSLDSDDYFGAMGIDFSVGHLGIDAEVDFDEMVRDENLDIFLNQPL